MYGILIIHAQQYSVVIIPQPTTIQFQLLLAEDNFHKSMQDTTEELELLRQHKVMLQEQLQTVEEHRPGLRYTIISSN